MYLDLPECANLPEACMATFQETGPPRTLARLRLWRDDRWAWCAVTGWSESGAVPALIQAIEESGDGPALLAHGGDQGLRLAEVAGPEAPAPRWDLDDATQWGEPFLIVTPEAEWRGPTELPASARGLGP
jgi:hypothetical protein